MLSPAVISAVVLAAVFVVGTVRGINLGVLGFVAAFGVGVFSVGMPVDDIAAGFPVDLFLALVGLSFLFGFARQNGSLDLIVRWGVHSIGGRVAVAPWGFFVLSAVLMSIGAVFAVAIVAPLAMPFARRFRIDQTMMGAMVVHGAVAGALSPVSVYGVFLNGALAEEGLSTDPAALMLAGLIFNTVAAAIVYISMGGLGSIRTRGRAAGDDLHSQSVVSPKAAGRDGPETLVNGKDAITDTVTLTTGVAEDRPTRTQVATLIGIAVMAVGVAVFNVDVGAISLAVAAVLAVISPKAQTLALSQVSWSTVLLVTGMVTYIAVCQAAGVTEDLGDAIALLGIPLLAVLLLCYLEGLVSAMASSIATMGVAFAIAAPILSAGQINATGFAAAIGISATVVDVSPFSTQGALILANVDEENHPSVYRRLLIYTAIVVATAPALAWLTIVLPNTR